MQGTVETVAAAATLLGVVGTILFGSNYAIGGSRPSVAELIGLGGVETVGFAVSLVLFAAGVLVLGRPGAEGEGENA